MPLPYLPLNPNLQCEQIKKNGLRCNNPKAYGTSRCRYHGATPPASRKKVFGESNGNFKTGYYTQQESLKRQRTGSNMNALVKLGISCGMFKANPVGRPFTLHPDTHANQVLALQRKHKLAADETKDFIYRKLMEMIKE